MVEPSATEPPAPAPEAEPGAEEVEPAAPTLDEIKAWSGERLDEIGGASVAKIEGAYVDESSGEPHWLLVRMGRFGHHALVPSGDAVPGVGRVWVPYDRDAIRSAPKVNAGKPVTREQELELCSHYGIPDGIGRAAELAALPPGVGSAHPAE